jgi:Spy/CpxP family protein refolding chaperone
MRNTIRRAVLCSVPLAAMLVVACDKSSSGDGPGAGSASAPIAPASAPATVSASALATASAAPSASAKPGGDRRGGGPTGMFLRAARDLTDLKDPQKATLDKLEDTLKGDGSGGGMMSEFKGVHDDMVAGIKAGKIDAAKMTAHYAAIDKAAQAKQDKETDALNSLYAALEPAQRKAVVAAIRAKQAEHGDHDGDKKGMGDGGASDWTKRRLDRMTKELGLDDAQQKSVAALLAKGPTPATMDAMRADGKKRIDAVLAAFEKDGFDAKKMDMSMTPGKKPHDMIDTQVQFVTQMLTILKADQRDKFAASMDRPMGRPDMGPAGDRPMGGSPFAHGPHDDD